MFSCTQVAKSPEEATSVTLQECFSLYTRAETLGQVSILSNSYYIRVFVVNFLQIDNHVAR
jgi:hypothetical protein